MPKSRFQRGSGCFTCKLCAKRTRDTGDNGSCELCPLCFSKSECGNSLSDSGYNELKLGNAYAVFADCRTPWECENLLTIELQKLTNAQRGVE